jgi:hypothetical protein
MVEPPQRARNTEDEESRGGEDIEGQRVECQRREDGDYRGRHQCVAQMLGFGIRRELADAVRDGGATHENHEQGDQPEEARLDRRHQDLIVKESVPRREEGARSAAEDRSLADESE